jgi:flagellar motor protein MotB
MIPCVLQIANNPLGKKWFKRVVVEGYTDRTGDYLHNLNLSLQRSQRVLCVLLGAQDLEEQPLSLEQKKQIQQLFFVGGYSSGSAKENLAASRRIELRLEFWDLKEKREDPVDAFQPKIGKCAL